MGHKHVVSQCYLLFSYGIYSIFIQNSNLNLMFWYFKLWLPQNNWSWPQLETIRKWNCRIKVPKNDFLLVWHIIIPQFSGMKRCIHFIFAGCWKGTQGSYQSHSPPICHQWLIYSACLCNKCIPFLEVHNK